MASRVREAPPRDRPSSSCTASSYTCGLLLFGLAELSYITITYHAGLTHFLFAHIIAEVCDALALVTIALGLGQRVAPLVPGALPHRDGRAAHSTGDADRLDAATSAR